MNIFNSVNFGKKLKRSRKCHVYVNGHAYCDDNIADINIVADTIGVDVCSNCLNKLFTSKGASVAAHIELLFYFNQYSGGSAFLDSIKSRIESGKNLSGNQIKTSIDIFRQGSFRYSKNHSDQFNDLYEN